jgi:hypothetical protein
VRAIGAAGWAGWPAVDACRLHGVYEYAIGAGLSPENGLPPRIICGMIFRGCAGHCDAPLWICCFMIKYKCNNVYPILAPILSGGKGKAEG